MAQHRSAGLLVQLAGHRGRRMATAADGSMADADRSPRRSARSRSLWGTPRRRWRPPGATGHHHAWPVAALREPGSTVRPALSASPAAQAHAWHPAAISVGRRSAARGRECTPYRAVPSAGVGQRRPPRAWSRVDGRLGAGTRPAAEAMFTTCRRPRSTCAGRATAWPRRPPPTFTAICSACSAADVSQRRPGRDHAGVVPDPHRSSSSGPGEKVRIGLLVATSSGRRQRRRSAGSRS